MINFFQAGRGVLRFDIQPRNVLFKSGVCIKHNVFGDSLSLASKSHTLFWPHLLKHVFWVNIHSRQIILKRRKSTLILEKKPF